MLLLPTSVYHYYLQHILYDTVLLFLFFKILKMCPLELGSFHLIGLHVQYVSTYLNMCVRAYLCIYVCLSILVFFCVCKYVFTYACILVFVYVCICRFDYLSLSVCVYVRAYICICICVFTYVCIKGRMYVCVCVYVFRYVHPYG